MMHELNRRVENAIGERTGRSRTSRSDTASRERSTLNTQPKTLDPQRKTPDAKRYRKSSTVPVLMTVRT